jgi:glutathione S-transferase
MELSRWPALKDYAKRVAERPMVRETMKTEGLVK